MNIIILIVILLAIGGGSSSFGHGTTVAQRNKPREPKSVNWGINNQSSRT